MISKLSYSTQFIVYKFYIQMNSLSILSWTLFICVASCEPSFDVTEQAITGLDTPHARPKATLEGTNTYGVFYERKFIQFCIEYGGMHDWNVSKLLLIIVHVSGRYIPCLRTKVEGVKELQGDPYQRPTRRTRTCHGWEFLCLKTIKRRNGMNWQKYKVNRNNNNKCRSSSKGTPG